MIFTNKLSSWLAKLLAIALFTSATPALSHTMTDSSELSFLHNIAHTVASLSPTSLMVYLAAAAFAIVILLLNLNDG